MIFLMVFIPLFPEAESRAEAPGVRPGDWGGQ